MISNSLAGEKYEYSIARIILGKVNSDPKSKLKIPITYIDASYLFQYQTPLVLKEPL